MNTAPTTPTNQNITFQQYNAAERNAALDFILANARTIVNLERFIEEERHLLGRTVENIQRSNALSRAESSLQSLQSTSSKSKRKLEFGFFNTDEGNNNVKKPPRRDDDDNNDSNLGKLTNAMRYVNIGQ